MSKYFDLDKLKEMIEAKAETVLPEHKSAFLYISQWLNHLPAADVEPVRHGHWIRRDKNNFECSICERIVGASPSVSVDVINNIFKRCPDCGAKMDGKENEEGAQNV